MPDRMGLQSMIKVNVSYPHVWCSQNKAAVEPRRSSGCSLHHTLPNLIINWLSFEQWKVLQELSLVWKSSAKMCICLGHLGNEVLRINCLLTVLWPLCTLEWISSTCKGTLWIFRHRWRNSGKWQSALKSLQLTMTRMSGHRRGQAQEGARCQGRLGWQSPEGMLSSCRLVHPQPQASSPNTICWQENSQPASFAQLKLLPKLFKKINYPSIEWGNGEAKSWATWKPPAEHPLCCVCSVPAPGALLLQCKCEVQLP